MSLMYQFKEVVMEKKKLEKPKEEPKEEPKVEMPAKAKYYEELFRGGK